jgi:hypothetical protein
MATIIPLLTWLELQMATGPPLDKVTHSGYLVGRFKYQGVERSRQIG